MYLLWVAVDIAAAVVYTQVFKFALKTAKDHGAMTVMMQLVSAVMLVLFIPFFGWQLPTDSGPVIALVIASVFYGVSDRINTTVRSGVEASTYSIIKQLSTVMMVIAGLVFLHEPFIAQKLLGGALIVIANVAMFWSPHHKVNKYLLYGLGSCVLVTVALLVDVGASAHYNLPFYLAVSFAGSATTLVVFGRISPKRIVKEARQNQRINLMVVVGMASGIMMMATILAFQSGPATVVAPLRSLTVLANVIVGYIVLKERTRLPKKLIATALIILGVILIQMAP